MVFIPVHDTRKVNKYDMRMNHLKRQKRMKQKQLFICEWEVHMTLSIGRYNSQVL
jgi:hypothetical protein